MCMCVIFLSFYSFIFTVHLVETLRTSSLLRNPSQKASQQAFSTGCSLGYRSLTFYCVAESFRHTVHNVVLACFTVRGAEKLIPSPTSVLCAIAFLISQMSKGKGGHFKDPHYCPSSKTKYIQREKLEDLY